MRAVSIAHMREAQNWPPCVRTIFGGDILSCFKPNLIKYFADPETGLVESRFISRAYRGRDNIPNDPRFYGTPYVDPVWYSDIPCGECEGCKCDYGREWSNRMCLELMDYPNAIFLTLTYNDAHLPRSDRGNPTLCKRDLQLFFKRLRKHFPGYTIRYYIAGEYGSRTFRPHYHAIIYGIGLSDFSDTYSRGFNDLGQEFFSSPTLEHIWSNGFVLFSDVSWRTCNYVARYVIKKQLDKVEQNLSVDQVPPFNLSSRRPGLGMSRSIELLKDGLMYTSIGVAGEVHEFPIPRSIFKRLFEVAKNQDADFLSGLSNSVDFDIDFLRKMSYDRRELAHDRVVSELEAYGLPYDEVLRRKQQDLFSKLRMLPERGDK